MSALDLAELKRLAQAATPGPWKAALSGTEESGWVQDASSDFMTVGYEGEMAAKDVRFIAAANPAAVLALIQEVEALRHERSAHPGISCHAVEASLRRLEDQQQELHTQLDAGGPPRLGYLRVKIAALMERGSKLEALARKGLEAYHKGSGCPAAQHVDNPSECSHAACREWAAALEAK